MRPPAADPVRKASAARRLIAALVLAIAVVPVVVAAASPLQASRDAVWILGGMAGVVALALLFLQPILMSGLLPQLRAATRRRWHRLVGSAVVVLVLAHVLGLYLTSPEDITDALLLVSPTPFAVYGVMGLVAVLLTGCLAAFRKRLSLRVWRIGHLALAAVIAVGSIVHAVLIEGVMGELSKLALCLAVGVATAAVILKTMAGARRSPDRPAPALWTGSGGPPTS